MSRFTSKQGGTNQFLHHTDKKKASFFKIIHPNIIKDQQLDLPIMFVKKYENDLSGHVTLKVPTGYVWNIKLKKANGRTYLSDGWKDFVDHHSICAGHVLTFRYDGNSSFYVIICDMTTVEIEYPSKKVKLENRTHGLETLVPGKNVVDNSTRKLTAQLGELSVKNGQLRKLVAEERIKDVMPSMASKPKNPYFVVVMQPSYVGGRCQLNVPGSFMKKHLGKGSQDITMCVLDDASHERIWGARYLCYNNWAKLAWKTFAKDNDLRKNDVCMFELARMKSATFKVSIFREVEEVIPKAVTAHNWHSNLPFISLKFKLLKCIHDL
ncbi:B3 domain-containing transcription factor vrn1 [Thalictrum thalictroides]|uniref:B3 domain-containing transcription factor vrn1 n=1 Tax=Thalictrum thalictroides TaxID=46969 RepID=A0A7J6W2G3_THATH|nr:B3 domain-containing transcription factor vrn1 [Thalictrum thalictroides]